MTTVPDVARLDDKSKMAVYNALDASNTLAIAQQIFPELEKDPAYKRMYDDTMRLWPALMYMMTRGVRVNTTGIERAKKEADVRLESLQKELNKLVGKELNPNSPQQLVQYFYIDLGIPPYTKRDKESGESRLTVDDKALQRLSRGTSSRKARPEAKIIQQMRQLRKLKGTYLDIIFDKDQRLRCSYNPRGTRFSRLSSGKTVFETGMNMQNLPSEFKVHCIADEGCIFIEMDKRQAEWVVVAYVAGEENMIRVIEAGEDPHAHTAQQILRTVGVDIDIATIKSEHKLVGSSTDAEIIRDARTQNIYLSGASWLPRTMSIRQMGKKSNHGLNYKEGYKQFALINELQEKESFVIVEGYASAYPGVGRWHDWVKGQLTSTRTIYDLFGRKYRFLDRYNNDLWKAAISCCPQSTVGHLVNLGIIDIYYDRDPVMSEVEMLAQTHDSILFQHPLTSADNLARMCHRARFHLEPTLEANGRSFVIQTDMKIGFSWGNLMEVPFGKTVAETTENLQKALGKLTNVKEEAE